MTQNKVPPISPTVSWQGSASKPYALFRLEKLQGISPPDGHDPWVPHRIGFHALILVTDGEFDHVLDFRTRRLVKKQLVYVAPNQVHCFTKNRPPHKAIILAFRPEILPAELLQPDAQRVHWSTMCYRWPAITTLGDQQLELLLNQLEFLEKLEDRLPENNGATARYHVCGIVSLAFELSKRNHNEPTEWRSDRQFLDFVQLVEECYTQRRDTSWYAKRLDCSPRTLNRICQKMLGKTAKAFLQQRVVVEAKRSLAYEGDSIGNVAERLGFTETSNFARFFKLETGMSPQDFRNSLASDE
jgi:AraC-like DNA-binding protein